MILNRLFFCSFFLLFSLSITFAKEETGRKYFQAGQLKKGGSITLRDDAIFGSGGNFKSNWSQNFGIKQTSNSIELSINKNALNANTANFSATFHMNLYYKDKNNQVVPNWKGNDTTKVNLTIHYKKSADYRNKDTYAFAGGVFVYVEITKVEIKGINKSNLSKMISLGSVMKVEKYYHMSNVILRNISHTYDSRNNVLFISWKDKKGAELYDLEWTFVDNYDYNQSGNMQRLSKSDVVYDFDNYSQRVRLPLNSYSIPLVFEEGYIVYRVRPLAKGGKDFNRIIDGPWTLKQDSGKVSNAGKNVYQITSSQVHENDKKNWMYLATHAENGKKIPAVDYYDGLHYNRQHVRQIPTENDVMISEVLYDYHGREAVNVLPAPTGRAQPDESLHYFENFNRDKQGNAYSKKNFDNFSNCNLTPEPMDENSGAAKYYSSNNKNQGAFRDYLPKANGYPFSQKQFVPDQTKRFRRLGNVGEKLQLGKGHTKQFFYGTPGQGELDRLFGSDVGRAIYYRKKIIADQNGQLRVRYLDSKDNVIATALAGAKPNALDALPPEQLKSETIKDDLLKDRQVKQGHTLLATKQIAVTTENTQYSFKYKIKPATFKRHVCNNEKICYDGIYNLDIKLTDECGKVIKDTSLQIGNIQNIDEKCNDHKPVTIRFSSGPLSIGSYQITKKLSLNEQALQTYLSLFAQKQCIREIIDTLRKEELDKLDTASCIGCGKKGKIKKGQTEYTYETDDGKTRTESLSDEEMKQLQERSEDVCGAGENMCESAFEAMLSDMQPGGQYAKYYDTTQNEINVGKFDLSIFNDNNMLPDRKAYWRNPKDVYRDENGDTSYIDIRHLNSGPRGVTNDDHIVQRNGIFVVLPQYILHEGEFIDMWQDSWAKALIPYHPEYCYYEYCSQFPGSNDFDRDVLATGKYEDARDSGYVDKSGNLYLLSKDPFFQQHPALKQDMKDSLKNFVNMEGHVYSAVEIVIAMENGCAPLVCDSNVNYTALDNCIKQNTHIIKGKDKDIQNAEWGTYRTMYMALKNQIKNHERHQYAINCGTYNGCIGLDYWEKRTERKILIDDFKISAPLLTLGNNPCSQRITAYKDKSKRFPDGDDLFYEVDGVDPSADPFTKMKQAENYVDNRLKRQCDKCPVEQDLETLLSALTLEDKLTKNGDISDAIPSCELKKQMTNSNKRDFNWQVNINDRELVGKIMLAGNPVFEVKLYDTTKTYINWSNILFFSCLEHITNTNQYNSTQPRNFKVRAVTKDREVYWLEGVTSTIDLTQCDITKLCTKNTQASALGPVFDKVFGSLPLMRQYLIDNGYQQQAQNMSVYQNTKLVTDVEVTKDMTNELKRKHVEKNKTFYRWKTDNLSSDKRTLEAGIYGKQGCSFTFEILDRNKKFGEPFMVTNIMVNHPALKNKQCDLKQLVLEAKPFEMDFQNISEQNISDAFQLGEPFYIKVTNTCYTFGDCCPPSDCEIVSDNYDFEGRNKGFSSELPYSDSGLNKAFYTIHPKKDIIDMPEIINDLNQGKFREDLIRDYKTLQFQDIQQTEKKQQKDIQTKKHDIKDQEIDTEQLPETKQQLQIEDLNFKLNNEMVFRQFMQLNVPDLDETVLTRFTGEIMNTPQPEVMQVLERNHYLVFFAGNKNNPKVWIQTIEVEPQSEYLFSCYVKPMIVEKGLTRMPPPPKYTFSIEAGNDNIQLNQAGSENEWEIMEGRFNSGNNNKITVALVFNTPNNVLNWGVDNIKIQAQHCENIGCCPPVPPAIPDSGIGNPCVEKKKSIAESNAETEYEKFLEDTLSGIRAGYIADIMKPDETFTIKYSDNFYDYTLNYYDRAGNRVKIIPPKGFNPLQANEVRRVQNHRDNNRGSSVYPSHTHAIKLEYDAFNQIRTKTTPDNGTTNYWYDRLGRVVAVQDAEQASRGNYYTYKFYDPLNRDKQHGEVEALNALQKNIAKNYNKFVQWVKQGTRTEVTRYYYDTTLSKRVRKYFPDMKQKHLRQRLASVTYEEKYNSDINTYDFGVHYSYDIHGNIAVIINENNAFPQRHKIKKIKYEYDVISNNIKKIIYQPNALDQFIHKYEYDEENRMSKVLTSRFGITWEEDADFFYYPHGRLARVELGEEKVQGIDYAYTLQGWLKGFNSSILDPSKDMGQDGATSGRNKNVGKDVFNLALDYFPKDYEPVGGGNSLTGHLNGSLGNSSDGLYNSNIRQYVANNAAFTGKQNTAYAYTYDQLGRLVKADMYTGNQNNWQVRGDYNATYAYDANGNMKKIKRTGQGKGMDDLSFHYQVNTNKIRYVTDKVGDNEYPNDLDNQQNNNYGYDAKGRLTHDFSSNIQNIRWGRRNHIQSVVKSDGTKLYYDYDPHGFKIVKSIDKSGRKDDKNIYYVRGADNEVMATYEYNVSEDSLYIKDYYLYGNFRFGLLRSNSTYNSINSTYISNFRGKKQYELYDHLENVVATVSDRRLFQTSGGNTDKNAEVVSATGYYPYGSQQPGRTVNAELYDYGYQGQEKDNELQGKGNSYYFTSRIYDSRLGRWLSTDPKNMKSPEESPYAGMGNNPVSMIDPRGQQKYWCEFCGESYAFVLNDYIGEQWINPFLTEEFDKNYQEWFRKKMVNDPTFRSKQIKNYEALIGVLQRIEAAGDIAEAGLMLYGGGGAVIKSAKGLKAAGLVKATAGTFKLSFSIFATGAGVAGKTTEGISEGVTGEQYQGPRIGKVASFEFAGDAFFGEKGKIVGAALDKFLVFRGYLKGLNKKEITETIENAGTIEKIDKTVEFLKKLKEAKEMGEKAGEAAAELEQTIERLEEKKKELEEEKEAEDSFDSYSAPDNAVYCFEAGTQVLMADGSQKNIEDVDAGDMVKTFNRETKKTGDNKVMNTTQKQRSDMIRIEFGNKTVNTNSADHPYYVVGKGWCSYTPKLSSQRYDLDVSQLEVGDECYEYSNGNVQNVQVRSIEELNITTTTYNLDVISNSNTYFANGILVHNK